MKPKGRLLEDPAITPELRADLERAARAAEPFDAAAGLASLQAAIEAERVPQAATGHGVRRLRAGVIALPILAAALAAAAAVGFQHYAAPPPGADRKPVPSPARSVQAPRAPRTVVPVVQEPAVTPEPKAAPAAPKRLAAIDGEQQREVAQLGRIRELLERDPREALQLAQAGHREFGRGMLHEEREGLAVMALWRLGRSDEARARTQAFVVRYPRSALREQIERMAREHANRDGAL